jgi:hypothetical protein
METTTRNHRTKFFKYGGSEAIKCCRKELPQHYQGTSQPITKVIVIELSTRKNQEKVNLLWTEEQFIMESRNKRRLKEVNQTAAILELLKQKRDHTYKRSERNMIT